MVDEHKEYELKEYIKLIAMTASGAIIEVICFADSGHLYAGIMTGNTIQLGLNIWSKNWMAIFPLVWVISFFVFGCVIGQIIKIKFSKINIIVSHFTILLLICISSMSHFHKENLIIYEVPLLSLSIAIQAINFSAFDGVNLQTIVTTNNIVKFISGIVSKVMLKDKEIKKESIYLPGICWLTFIFSSLIGGYFYDFYKIPLILPIIIHFVYFICGIYDWRKESSCGL